MMSSCSPSGLLTGSDFSSTIWIGPHSPKGTTLTIIGEQQNGRLLVQDRGTVTRIERWRNPGMPCQYRKAAPGFAHAQPGLRLLREHDSWNRSPYDRFSSHLSMRADARGGRVPGGRAPTWGRAWRESAAACGGAC